MKSTLESGVSQGSVNLRQWVSFGGKLGSRKAWEYNWVNNDKETLLSDHDGEVPKGFMAVYVGQEKRRYVIPTTYLSMSEFRVLMDKAGEEFGYNQQGGLQLPCEEHHFEEILVKCFKLSSSSKSKTLRKLKLTSWS